MTQLILQLGISALVLWVAYRIALVVLKNWRESEKERNATFAKAEDDRTKALATGFAALLNRVETHHDQDIASHFDLGEGIVEIKTKLDEARWYRDEITNPGSPPPSPPRNLNTPSRGVRVPRPGTHHDKDR